MASANASITHLDRKQGFDLFILWLEYSAKIHFEIILEILLALRNTLYEILKSEYCFIYKVKFNFKLEMKVL